MVFTPEGLQKAIDLNHAIGSKYIIMASAGQITGPDGWKGVADQLTAAQAKLEPLGMGTGYHNHGAEWHEVDGKRPMDIIAAGTPKSVTLQFDIGTAVEAGVDPKFGSTRIQDAFAVSTARTGSRAAWATPRSSARATRRGRRSSRQPSRSAASSTT